MEHGPLSNALIYLAAAVLGRRFGIARGQQVLFAILLAQGGEFALVVFGAAAAARVFTAPTASLLVVVVTLSMVATPLLLLLYDKLIAPRLRRRERRPGRQPGAGGCGQAPFPASGNPGASA